MNWGRVQPPTPTILTLGMYIETNNRQKQVKIIAIKKPKHTMPRTLEYSCSKTRVRAGTKVFQYAFHPRMYQIFSSADPTSIHDLGDRKITEQRCSSFSWFKQPNDAARKLINVVVTDL